MCESSVYLLKGAEKTLVMSEAARVLATSQNVLCISLGGDRETLPGAWIAEADLMKHEIILKSR
jgi:predicted RNA-binding protein